MPITDSEFQQGVYELMSGAERIRFLRHPLEPGSAEALTAITAEAVGIEQPVPWWLYALAHTVIVEVRNGRGL